MKTCWSIISTIVLAVLVILLIAFGGVRLFGLTPYMVTSGSMEPEYPVGSLIYVKEVPPEQIDVGDVITFRLTDGQTVATHQVYEADRAQEEFRTQGINNRDSEGNILHDAEPVKYTSVLGCPVTVIPYLGYVNRFCTTAPGVYILIGGAVAILVISLLIDGRTEKVTKKPVKRRKRKNTIRIRRERLMRRRAILYSRSCISKICTESTDSSPEKPSSSSSTTAKWRPCR